MASLDLLRAERLMNDLIPEDIVKAMEPETMSDNNKDSVTINEVVESAANVARKIYEEQVKHFNPQEVDQDIMLLVQGKYVHREFYIGSSTKVVLRDLKARDYRMCQVMAMETQDDPETGVPKVVIDPQTSRPVINIPMAGFFQTAAGIESISNVEFPPLHELPMGDERVGEEEIKAYNDAILARYRWIRETAPASIQKRIFEETQKFFIYLEKIADPEITSNF